MFCLMQEQFLVSIVGSESDYDSKGCWYESRRWQNIFLFLFVFVTIAIERNVKVIIVEQAAPI